MKAYKFLFVLALAVLVVQPPAWASLTGAIYTTNSGCTGVNVNFFAAKIDVYLDGGPAGGGSGLPDGTYYVKVTNPSGSDLLGTSIGSGNDKPVTVSGGKFVICYKLWDILVKGSDGTQGYDDTTNNGGVYKVWVSPDAGFVEAKTDNFKVRAGSEPVVPGTLNVIKFYDKNANGIDDDGITITGWKVSILGDVDEYIRYTPVSIQLEAGPYLVTEFYPIETNWMRTTDNPVGATIVAGQTTTVKFGNLCLGKGGGLTLGFWSNKNGQALFGADDLTLMRNLNLRNADGSDFYPADYKAFRTWLLAATATNMANMLSAQLAAMELNVLNGKVNGSALIYAPDTTSANALGFATVNAVMAEADAELALHGTAFSGDAWRSYQEALKNALDKANNDMTFVQPTPGPFTFAP